MKIKTNEEQNIYNKKVNKGYIHDEAEITNLRSTELEEIAWGQS